MQPIREYLYDWNSNEIYNYVKLLGGSSSVKLKDDRIAFVEEHMTNKEKLVEVWEQLDEISKRAVSTAYHNGGEYNPNAFYQQYGKLPKRPKTKRYHYNYRQNPILFDLFIIEGEIPSDVYPLLEDLVLPVERFEIEGNEEPPESVKLGSEEVPVRVIKTELTGRMDLITYLRMVEMGEVSFTRKGRRLTAASVRKVLDNLVDGDFREPDADQPGRKDVIRPFGLDVFAMEGGFVTRSSGNLTKAGRDYIETEDPDLLLEAFEQWTTNNGFDELTRIRELGGVGSKDTKLTDPGYRRARVIEALSWCPVDVWIPVTEFYRGLMIWDFDFDVEKTRWTNLDLGPYYFSHDNYWVIVNGSFINAVVWEYLATIGAVDILIVDDEDAAARDVEAYNKLLEISQYDGLFGFRINNLGAFLLGQAMDYTPPEPDQKDLFHIDEDRRVHVLESLQPAERLRLEAITEPVEEGVYQLTTQTIMDAVETGHTFEKITSFLTASHQGALPDEVSDWLDRLARNQNAIKSIREAIMIEITQPELLDLIQEDESLSTWAAPLDKKTVIVRSYYRSRFEKRLKELGYLLRE